MDWSPGRIHGFPEEQALPKVGVRAGFVEFAAIWHLYKAGEEATTVWSSGACSVPVGRRKSAGNWKSAS